MPDRLDRFVQDENIENFRKQIQAETDPARLELLRSLLRDEEAKRSGVRKTD
jgi:hypothetical protein